MWKIIVLAFHDFVLSISIFQYWAPPPPAPLTKKKKKFVNTRIAFFIAWIHELRFSVVWKLEMIFFVVGAVWMVCFYSMNLRIMIFFWRENVKKKQRLGLNTLRYCFLSWTINNKTIKRDSCIIATNMKCFGHYFLGPWKPVC